MPLPGTCKGQLGMCLPIQRMRDPLDQVYFRDKKQVSCVTMTFLSPHSTGKGRAPRTQRSLPPDIICTINLCCKVS